MQAFRAAVPIYPLCGLRLDHGLPSFHRDACACPRHIPSGPPSFPSREIGQFGVQGMARWACRTESPFLERAAARSKAHQNPAPPLRLARRYSQPLAFRQPGYEEPRRFLATTTFTAGPPEIASNGGLSVAVAALSSPRRPPALQRQMAFSLNQAKNARS